MQKLTELSSPVQLVPKSNQTEQKRCRQHGMPLNELINSGSALRKPTETLVVSPIKVSKAGVGQ